MAGTEKLPPWFDFRLSYFIYISLIIHHIHIETEYNYQSLSFRSNIMTDAFANSTVFYNESSKFSSY